MNQLKTKSTKRTVIKDHIENHKRALQNARAFNFLLSKMVKIYPEVVRRLYWVMYRLHLQGAEVRSQPLDCKLGIDSSLLQVCQTDDCKAAQACVDQTLESLFLRAQDTRSCPQYFSFATT